MRILLDTGPLVALINDRDAHHAWVTGQAKRLAPLFYTCEAVISEAHFLLGGVYGGSRQVTRLVEEGGIVISFSYAEHVARVSELMARYENVPMSFADACLVRMAEQYHDSRLFTTDSDFLIYRKNRRKPLDLILPAP